MSCRIHLVTALAAIAFNAATAAAQAHQVPHWEYDGTHGPAHWGTLDKSYAACVRGTQQSPIDIRHATAAELPPITFSYQPSPLSVIDNGHTIQVNYAPGSFIIWGDQRYELQQFHFHHPAEERVFGKAYPLVAHLVHKNAAGKLAVVAVLLSDGNSNDVIHTIWTHLPTARGKDTTWQGVSIDVSRLLPATRGYFTFSGSLTTPPCTEGVTWFVLKNPVQVSAEEIAVFAAKYRHNARPLQPLNGRGIQETK